MRGLIFWHLECNRWRAGSISGPLGSGITMTRWASVPAGHVVVSLNWQSDGISAVSDRFQVGMPDFCRRTRFGGVAGFIRETQPPRRQSTANEAGAQEATKQRYEFCSVNSCDRQRQKIRGDRGRTAHFGVRSRVGRGGIRRYRKKRALRSWQLFWKTQIRYRLASSLESVRQQW
jgi:hypothetical protein